MCHWLSADLWAIRHLPLVIRHPTSELGSVGLNGWNGWNRWNGSFFD
jgi:hypothetical protein